MKLTEKQTAVYEFIKQDYEITHMPVLVSKVVRILDLKWNCCYDRMHALERVGVIVYQETGYIPGKAPEEVEKKTKEKVYVDHGRANAFKYATPRNPLTWEEIIGAAEKLEYKTETEKGTKLRYVRGVDIDEDGSKHKHVITVYPLRAYPHGCLCAGKDFKVFIRWADVALHLRHPSQPIGENYWRDTK